MGRSSVRSTRLNSSFNAKIFLISRPCISLSTTSQVFSRLSSGEGVSVVILMPCSIGAINTLGKAHSFNFRLNLSKENSCISSPSRIRPFTRPSSTCKSELLQVGKKNCPFIDGSLGWVSVLAMERANTHFSPSFIMRGFGPQKSAQVPPNTIKREGLLFAPFHRSNTFASTAFRSSKFCLMDTTATKEAEAEVSQKELAAQVQDQRGSIERRQIPKDKIRVRMVFWEEDEYYRAYAASYEKNGLPQNLQLGIFQ